MLIKIYSMVKYEVTPKINVLGTIIIAVTIFIPLLVEKLVAKRMSVTLTREKMKNKRNSEN
ncbi:MAG: hypothetical protein JRH08_16755 [Deltaproteobacteria bacterium]|nr:hypothetical protein [Deltaproteobacteria bacterium]MBW2026762.1 hypothetical protein [Deltaproteobacteria bacterium]MBW2127265.1 hypothetical protein [Deltaproteobacteria bacterium]